MPDSEPFAHSSARPTPPAVSFVRPEPEAAGSAGARQLLALVRDSPACLASLAGPDHMVTVTNELFRGLFGNRPLAGLPLRAALPELTSQPFFGLLDEVYASGRTGYGVQAIAYPGRGGHGPVHFTFIGQAVRDAAGTVTGLLLFAYDVSAHVLARQWVETHEEQAARTRQQLAVANEQLSSTNEELDVINEELTVSNHELSVTNVELSLANQRLAVANKQLRAANEAMRRQAGELRRAEAAVRQLNDELVLTNEGLVDTVSNAVGEAEAAQRAAEGLNQQLAVVNDQLSAVNDQLGANNQQLTFTNSELDTFVYTASHDLQNPITNLEGLLAALREELPGDCQAGPAAPILALMQESVERFQRTLSHLAALARQPPALGAPPVPVSLAAVVQDVLLDLALPLAAAGAQVEVDVAACPAVAFPASNLRSVIYNLVSNALKYQRPGLPPRVEVRSRLENGGVLEVTDNGLGLTEGQQAQLFGLFQRVHTHVEGSGVGLYLVKKMVENSGGRIDVESQPGVGSTFRVYFNR
ncbi:hypothetical protein GCM10011375_38860 [Hymenobacter qilianensis]|uniref:Uncharacterized protein n=1 Tax=Hymenobacter qilianensis TaxID=1385715 RepID=A0ACB5PWT4_9BACT|nr:PAS domain-containing sensor histidine kinase [Hymenobacter qilianensis]GGF80036.1 hypothetical protein GCM10011375_38860 [Hymenobacter qilianensis]